MIKGTNSKSFYKIFTLILCSILVSALFFGCVGTTPSNNGEDTADSSIDDDKSSATDVSTLESDDNSEADITKSDSEQSEDLESSDTTDTSQEESEDIEPPPLEQEDEPLEAHHALLCYVRGPSTFTKQNLLPAAAYLVDDEITDTMYDTFLFLPVGGDNLGKASMRELEQYFVRQQFAKGNNMDALEEVIEDINTALGKNIKVNVIMSVLSPFENKNFGTIDGKSIDLTNYEDRKIAVKWMVDEQITQFKTREYKNLRLDGFYWYAESIDPGNEETVGLVRYFTDYVSSLGYTSNWIPYHGARGYNIGKTDCGFDRVNMQVNFFPGNPSFPNNYAYSDYYGPQTGRQSFNRAAQLINAHGLGYEMELGGSNQKAYTGFKIYMYFGIKNGFMKDYVAYYMGNGDTVFNMYRSKDEYIRSTYDQLHKFIKGTLKEEDLVFIPENAQDIIAPNW